MIERRLKEKLLLIVVAVCILTIIPFILLSLIYHDQVQFWVDLIALTILIGIFIGVYRSRTTTVYGTLLGALMLLTVSFVIFLKGHSAIYWLYPMIVVSFYLLSPIVASILNLLAISFCLLVIYHEITNTELARILASLFLTNIFSLIFSKYLEDRNKILTRHNTVNKIRNDILELIASSTNLTTILSKIVTSVEKELPDSMCSILLLDDTGKKLTVGAAPSLPKFYNDAIEGVSIGLGVGSCGHAAFTGQRTVVDDIQTHPYWSAWAPLASQAGLNTCWSEPITKSEGKVLGTFAVYYSQKTQTSDKEHLLVAQFTNLARIAIERQQADNIIWKQAHFDSLTNLPNRNMLREKLNSAISDYCREDNTISLAILDLDNFKEINDSFGHEAGDFILVECSKRIRNCIRPIDTAFRLGGDEFVVIMPEITNKHHVDSIGEKLLSTLAKPYYLKNEKVYCTASIGIANYPDDAQNIQSLLRNADQAMYVAKSKGCNNVYFFNEDIYAAYLKRMELIQDLHIAIKEKQFYIDYQPIINLINFEVTKAEALIRWTHPTKGLISPLDFIALAEDTGLISDISDWLFEEVSTQVQYWRLKYSINLQININTSPLQYQNKGRQVKHWVDALKKKGIPPEAIGLEITEDLVMENKMEAAAVIDDIRKKGISISIDDFGSGYSSFSYLKEFQIDYIKIDKSFVQNMSETNDDMALCEAIIVMAKKLKISVIAEGVETEQQLKLLTRAGCDFGQGFYLHRPLSQDKFELLLSESIQ